jgi:UDP-glucose 4-epimerase
VDDLSTGDASRTGDAPLMVGTVLHTAFVREVIREHDVRGIVHIAAKKQVGESVTDPLLYYRENVGGVMSVLDAAVAEGLESFVFSSSASAYGMPDVERVTEDMPGDPVSPYGESKLIGEWMSRAVGLATGLRVVSLRYFNVAGAATPALGDPGVFNLIPLAMRALTAGHAPKIFGADYPTPDGTCIRDYIHIADVADAHVAALLHLQDGGASAIYNVGRGEGSSVREVLSAVIKTTGIDIDPVVVDRRPGDPPRAVAGVDRIRADLGWSARYGLAEIVTSAWEAWQANPPR